MRLGRRAAALAVIVLALGWAAAEACVVVPGASEFTIEDLGRVVFEELRTDRAADAIRFGGGVCLEVAGERAVIRSEVLDVVDVGTSPRVRGLEAEVQAGGWRLNAAVLDATRHEVRLESATLVGEGLVGRADVLVLAIDAGVLSGLAVAVATASLRLDLGVGRFDGDTLWGESVVLSTCDCPPSEAGVRLEGAVVSYGLDTGVVHLEQGALLLGGVWFPLPSPVEVSEAVLADLRPPFSVSRDERRGWMVALTERLVAGGRVRADLAFTDARPPRARAYLDARDGPARASLVLTSGGADVRVETSFELNDDVSISLSQRLAAGLAERVQDAVVRVTVGRDATLASLRPGSLRALVEGTVALTAQERESAVVATPRAGVLVRLDAATPSSDLGVLRVRGEAGATGYAVVPTSQMWLGLEPRWDVAAGTARVTLSHGFRIVWGASPFDDEVDAVAPRHRTTLTLALRPDHDRWRIGAEARYSWLSDATRPGRPVGVERLRLDGRWALLDSGALTVALAGTLETAGWIDPRARRDAFARLAVEIGWPASGAEFALGATYSLVPATLGIRSLSLAGGAPVRWGNAGSEVRPYLALDVWPTLSGGDWPTVVGHGLGVVWKSRYGTLDVAYRSEPDGSFTSALAFRVEVRDPSLEDLRW